METSNVQQFYIDVSWELFVLILSMLILGILVEVVNSWSVHLLNLVSECVSDGIRSLDFGEDPKSIDIFAMVSSEGERILLGKNLKARGNVENWLTAVEQNMVSSLRRFS